VRGRLFWFRFDEELSVETDFVAVLHGQVQELGQVVEFAFQIGVVEVMVAFTPAPENVVGAAQFLGDF
jgi:hypothetical protein